MPGFQRVPQNLHRTFCRVLAQWTLCSLAGTLEPTAARACGTPTAGRGVNSISWVRKCVKRSGAAGEREKESCTLGGGAGAVERPPQAGPLQHRSHKNPKKGRKISSGPAVFRHTCTVKKGRKEEVGEGLQRTEPMRRSRVKKSRTERLVVSSSFWFLICFPSVARYSQPAAAAETQPSNHH